MKAVLIPFSLVLAFGLAGCGGGGGSSSSTPAPLTAAPQGAVGGQDIALTVTATGASVKLACGATGTITQPLNLDSTGHFDVPGTVMSAGASPTTISADYAGTTDGKTIHVTITTTGAGVISSSKTYDLTYGQTATFTGSCG